MIVKTVKLPMKLPYKMDDIYICVFVYWDNSEMMTRIVMFRDFQWGYNGMS